MEPTLKSAEIEEFLTAISGQDRRKSIKKNTCLSPPLGCGKEITGFKDSVSEREFGISGFCQNCQDGIFSNNEEDTRVSYVKSAEDAVGNLSDKLEAVWPEEDEITLDIDNQEDNALFFEYLPILQQLTSVVIKDSWYSKSGKGKHIILKLGKKVDNTTRLLLQACLGSDRKRELLGYLRLCTGDARTSVLFRPKV